MKSSEFFDIVDDPSLFYFRGYNLFKLFYVPFVFREFEQLSPARKPRPRRGFVWVLKRSLAFVRSLVVTVYLSILGRMNPRVLFYGTTGRHIVIGNTTFDLYNARIVEQRGRDQFVIIEDAGDEADKQYRPDLYLHDYALLIGLLYAVSRVILARDLRQYARALASRYPELGFSEAEITSKVLLFYAKFLTYRFLLTVLVLERVFMISNYGKEAFIAACKHKGIHTIELMHGSITAADGFYNFPRPYPDLFRRGLFPDKLAVYGEYWKQVVVQGNVFPQDSVIVSGYYLKVPDILESTVSRDKTVVLVSTQPTIQRELREYISFLKSQLDSGQWYIIIKPHPNENVEAYVSLLQPGFVTLADKSAYELLALADIHIGVYSGLLFEAIRYSVCNYALLVKSVSAYCQEVINSGVALPLRPDQLPEIGNKADVAAQFYFADYNPGVLFDDVSE